MFRLELPTNSLDQGEAEDPNAWPGSIANSPTILGKSPSCLLNLESGPLTTWSISWSIYIRRRESWQSLPIFSVSFFFSPFSLLLPPSLSFSLFIFPFFIPFFLGGATICQKGFETKSPAHRLWSPHMKQYAGWDRVVSTWGSVTWPSAYPNHCVTMPPNICCHDPEMGPAIFLMVILSQGLW